IGSDRYDLEAKIGGDVLSSRSQLRSMLQRLLADRFGFGVRCESKEMSVYLLETDKGETKLQSAKQPDVRDVPCVPAAADHSRECSVRKFDWCLSVDTGKAGAGSDRARGVVRL